MKGDYEKPQIQITVFNEEDVIRTTGGDELPPVIF